MLEKIFIKNYKNINNSEVRNKYAILSGVFGIITNAMLGILKLILGFLSNSISIMADAVNNLTDMITSILTVIGFKLSGKKPDKIHPYGHARYEYVFGVTIAFVSLEFGLIFGYESILKIINPSEIIINIYTYIVLVISILLKVLQIIVYKRHAKKINSKTLKALSIDTKNDILSTIVILVAMIVMDVLKINIDGILGLIVSLYVIYSSFNSLIETIAPLIGVRPSKKQVSDITKKLLSYDFVLGVHDLMIHNYGVLNDFITVHLELDSRLSMIEAHDLIDEIENDFKNEMNTQVTIHVDPIIIGDKKIDKMKSKILKVLKEINKDINIHDFRMIEGKIKTKILFDCVLPFEVDYTYKELKEILNSKIKGNYEYYIEIDRPFC